MAPSEKPEPVAPLPAGSELGRPSRRPFLIGVYLATNAIPDAALVVDGPDCAFFKAEFIHGKHDLRSTLLDVTGAHRILVSHVTTDDVATSTGQKARDLVAAAAARPNVGLVIVTSLPMVTIIGLQYDQLCRELAPGLDADLVPLAGRSLQSDWLGGYEDTLAALAEVLDVADAERREHGVSIIGYLMDRNEEDHQANVREMERLVRALGLEPDAIWLSGRPWEELQRARHSGILLALPLGRRAAEIIAGKTGARVMPIEAPFGMARTSAFIRTLASAAGRSERAEAIIDQELGELMPRLEWAVPHFFVGRRVAFGGTPDLLAGFCELATDLGLEVVHLSCPALRPAWFDPGGLDGPAPAFDEPQQTLSQRWRDTSNDGRPDLLIGNTDVVRSAPRDIPVIEFGYPSYADHALFERPYLGYRGALAFAQQMTTALGMHAARRWRG